MQPKKKAQILAASLLTLALSPLSFASDAVHKISHIHMFESGKVGQLVMNNRGLISETAVSDDTDAIVENADAIKDMKSAGKQITEYLNKGFPVLIEGTDSNKTKELAKAACGFEIDAPIAILYRSAKDSEDTTFLTFGKDDAAQAAEFVAQMTKRK